MSLKRESTAITLNLYLKCGTVGKSARPFESCHGSLAGDFGPVTLPEPNLSNKVVMRINWRRGERYKPSWVPIKGKRRIKNELNISKSINNAVSVYTQKNDNPSVLELL